MVLLKTLALPSAFIITMAPEMEGDSTAFTPVAMPLPLIFVPVLSFFFSGQSIALAAWRSDSLTPKART